MRNLFIFSFIASFAFSCQEQDSPPNHNITEELRDIYDSYLYNYYDTVSWSKNHHILKEKFSKADNPAYYEALNIAYGSYWPLPEKERLMFLDSIEQLPEFRNYHLYNQFTLYFVKARLSTQLGNFKNANDYALKAEQVLGDEWETYELEKNKVRSLMFESIGKFSLIDKPMIDLNIYYLEKLIQSKNKPDLEVFWGLYKIALSYHYLEEYQQSLNWINRFSSMGFNIKNLGFYSDIMNLKLQNFKNLNMKDSIIQLNKKMEDEFKQGSIDIYSYKLYQTYKFTIDAELMGADYALKLSDSLLEFFSDECASKNQRILIHNGRSKIFESIGEKSKAKDETLKSLNKIRSCKETEKFYREEESQIINRLIETMDYGKDTINYIKLIDRKEKIDSVLTEMSESFLELNDYFAQKENTNQEILSSFELKKSKQKHIINFIILAILLVLVFGVAYLLFMHRKINLSKKEIIEKKKQLKVVQNQIKIKNKNLKNLRNLMERRNEMLKNFAFRGAKDIKSPLLTIQRNLDKIAELYTPVFNNENSEIIEYLRNSTEELGIMIETLLEYSTKEKNIKKDEKIDVENILKSVNANLSTQILLNNAEINIPKDIPTITANKTLIEKLFQNIIANALKYHRENVAPKIDISYDIVNEQFVKFTIADNGVGIPKEKLEQVFQIFYQVDREKQFEGNGIGLSICRKIVLEFGGNIWVDSELGKGSKFHFTLPIMQEALGEDEVIDKKSITA